jgi:hypothetical protein
MNPVHRLGWALAGAVALCAIGAEAKAKPQAAATVKAPSQAAFELARIIAPANQMLEAELSIARRGFAMLPEADPEFAKLEKEHPGFVEVLWKGAEPELRKYMVVQLPRLHETLAKLYSSRLSEAEIDGLRQFYSSPTGQKLVMAMYANVDPAPLIQSFVKEERILEQAVAAAQADARAKAIQSLGEDDEAAFTRLSQVIALEKFKALGEDTQKLLVKWVNEPDPEFEARIEKVMEQVAERYFADK